MKASEMALFRISRVLLEWHADKCSEFMALQDIDAIVATQLKKCQCPTCKIVPFPCTAPCDICSAEEEKYNVPRLS